MAPNAVTFGLALALVGAAAQTVTTLTISLVQLSTAPAVRGHVALLLPAMLLGGLTVGAPLWGG